MMKAYIIMAHKNPSQVHRLISRLNDGRSAFFLNIDKKVPIAPFEVLKEFGEIIHFVERVNIRWAGFGSVQASLNALKAIKDSKEDFERVFLLSGQDYPIKSNRYINAFLKNSSESVFIEYDPIPNYQKWPGADRGGLYRVDKYFLGLKWHELFRSKSMNFLATYLPFLRRKTPNDMIPFTGSAWWSLDSYALDYILSYHEKHSEYGAFHHFTFVPDELYFNMLIANSKDEKLLASLKNNNKRLIIWESPSAAHPNTLRVNDFDTILASDQLFARKFDVAKDAEILDLIDRHILWKTQTGVNAGYLNDKLNPSKDIEVA